MPRSSDVDPRYERFALIVNAPALFNAIVTGLELDIFGYLSDHPESTFEEIQAFTGVPGHQLRVLLLGLCATALVERRDGRYANSTVAQTLLSSHAEDSWRHILIGWQRIYYPAFAHMTDAVRAGTNAALSAHSGSGETLYQRLTSDPGLEAILHSSMAAFTLQSMPGLLDYVEAGSIGHLLDVGGGDGTTAIALARRDPALRITIFDMPSVTGLAQRSLPDDLVNRVGLHPGDLFADAFPKGVDAVLFSHVLEVFSPDRIRFLLDKAYRVLPPGGRLLLYGFHAEEGETGGVLAARLSLYLNVLATGEGMAYPARDYEQWLREVGCTKVESFTGLPYEHGLIVGKK